MNSTLTSACGALEIDDLLKRLNKVVGPTDGGVALHEPRFDGAECDYLRETIESGWVSSVGAYVDRFEAMLAEICEVPFAVATVNGTAALHAALIVSGVQPGDEVLVPSLTFIATANAVSYCGAVPHFCDSETRTLGLNPVKLNTYLDDIAEQRDSRCWNRHSGRRIAALLPMHTFGHPADLEKLIELAERWSIPLIEDAAEALGSRYRGKPAGCHGGLATLSFNGNKIITTGGGGAILIADPELARAAKHLTTTAKVPHRWRFNHDQIGFNYRLPNLNAALGVAQLERLPDFVAAKRRLAGRYIETFAGFNGASIMQEPEGCKSNYWLNTLLLDKPDEGQLEQVLEATNNAGYMTRPIWTPMHKLAIYAECPHMDLSTCEELSKRIINLPSSMGLELDRGV